jgi:hypothetical protein
LRRAGSSNVRSGSKADPGKAGGRRDPERRASGSARPPGQVRADSDHHARGDSRVKLVREQQRQGKRQHRQDEGPQVSVQRTLVGAWKLYGEACSAPVRSRTSIECASELSYESGDHPHS